MEKRYMAIDQYGQVFHGLTHPRKDLMERLDKSHADKMFVDRNGGTYHVGYIIGGLWLTIYEVYPVEKPA